MVEYAHRDADNPLAVEADGTAALDEDGNPTGDVVSIGNALNLQAGYLFKCNLEVVGRYTTTNFDNITGRGNEDQYTLGVSKYVVGHKLKVQSDLSYKTVNGNDDNITFRVGFDLHF